MPQLTPAKLFIKDLEQFRSNKVLRKKIVKALASLEADPLHPGLHLERIINDPSAWSARVDGRHRLSLDPGGYLPAGNPDWSVEILLLRILDHDDLYKSLR
jgi:Txe/YoeB family toxin of Txe-Axe toxin-antitoxin module